jgi:hypothetical protein
MNLENLPRFRDHACRINELIPVWAQSYQVSTAAIERQILFAAGWCASNPRRAPKRDVVRFLFNWMSKAKKMGNLVEEKKIMPIVEIEPDLSYEEMVAIRKQNIKEPAT